MKTMTTLVLEKSALVETLEQIANLRHTTAISLLHLAISEFLEKATQQKIKEEDAAFIKLHSQLVTPYLGRYVAIHNGEVVDNDTDVRALHLRIRQQFGRIPVLLRQVTAEKEPRDLILRSPKLETRP